MHVCPRALCKGVWKRSLFESSLLPSHGGRLDLSNHHSRPFCTWHASTPANSQRSPGLHLKASLPPNHAEALRPCNVSSAVHAVQVAELDICPRMAPNSYAIVPLNDVCTHSSKNGTRALCMLCRWQSWTAAPAWPHLRRHDGLRPEGRPLRHQLPQAPGGSHCCRDPCRGCARCRAGVCLECLAKLSIPRAAAVRMQACDQHEPGNGQAGSVSVSSCSALAY